MATSTVSKYNGTSAYNLLPNGIDTREVNGSYTPNAIIQNSLNFSYDFANPECYTGTGTTTTSLVNSSTGTINGAPTYTQNGWFECDAVNDYISLGGWTRPVNWSGGFWFSLNDWSTPVADTTYYLYDTRLGTTNKGLRLTLRRYAAGDNEIRLRWVNSGANENTNISESIKGSAYFQSNQWYYFCWSRTNSTNITIWMSNPITGVLDELANFTPVSGIVSSTMSNNTYGCADQIGLFFDGNLGELHEYSIALSYSNFERNFNNTKARYGY